MKFKVGDIVRHVKSKDEYVILQEPDGNKLLEADNKTFYVYTSSQGFGPTEWHRAAIDMEDGRFELVPKEENTV